MNPQLIKSLYKVPEITIRYQYKTPFKDRLQINSSDTAFEVLRHAWDKNKIELQEEFKILLLDTGNNCLGIVDIASGSIDACIVDIQLILSAALKAKAGSIILSHNHPSGYLDPSESDKKLTINIWQGAQIFGIDILDHLIVSAENYYSFADNDILPSQLHPDQKAKGGKLPPMNPKQLLL